MTYGNGKFKYRPKGFDHMPGSRERSQSYLKLGGKVIRIPSWGRLKPLSIKEFNQKIAELESGDSLEKYKARHDPTKSN